VLRSLCYYFLKILAAFSFLTLFVGSVLQLREKCEKASARRGVLKSKALRRCTLVLRRCRVPAPWPLCIVKIAMRQTSECLALIVCSLTAKRSLASSKTAAPDRRPASRKRVVVGVVRQTGSTPLVAWAIVFGRRLEFTQLTK
jgi:hypothetical protein